MDAENGGKIVRDRPAAYTPGTKMPEQRIGPEEDRDALVNFSSERPSSHLFGSSSRSRK